jgi:large subunit ribosomal protein L21
MFAIIEDGGRQFQVSAGQKIHIDLRDGGTGEAGQSITFDRVLLANGGGSSKIGSPALEGATVIAEIVNPLHKGTKIEIGKMRRRKTYRRHTGHRQRYTEVQITSLNIPGLEVVEKKAEAASESQA